MIYNISTFSILIFFSIFCVDTDVPSRRNSQDAILYHVRRLSTSSSTQEDFYLKYSTQWSWYWQDSFGMWRSFPRKLTDVIETTAACISDEIEAKYLTGILRFLKSFLFSMHFRMSRYIQPSINPVTDIFVQFSTHRGVQFRQKYTPSDWFLRDFSH